LRDANVVAEALTAVPAHLLVGKVLNRIALPKLDEAKQALASRRAAWEVERAWAYELWIFERGPRTPSSGGLRRRLKSSVAADAR
jgi:hypothetical protein